METGGSDTDDSPLRPSGFDLSTDGGIDVFCENIVALAVMITGADMGAMQLLDGASGTLKLCACLGFDRDSLSCFDDISTASPTACGRALAQGRRVVVTDIYTSDVCDEFSLALLTAIGVMAMQATPIVSQAGSVIGMVTTYWRSPHEPSRHVLGLVDKMVNEAAARIEDRLGGCAADEMWRAPAGGDLLFDLLRAETIERRRLQHALHDSQAHLQRVLQAGEVVSYEWDCASDALIFTRNCESILGLDTEKVVSTNQAWEERVHPEDRQRFREAVERLRRACGRLVISYRYVRPDGSVMWLEDSGVGEYDDSGGLRRVCGLVRDVTARKRMEELQQLLMREFDHRARNMLATIQAMISLTARTQTQVGDFVTAVQNRIRSMARAHELIAGSRWTGASLRDIVERELEPYVADRPGAASVTGRDEILTPGATMAVAMALHELVTNAAKYGALSTAEGHVRLQFHRGDEGALVLEWSESGGPEVIPPRRRGFGSLLIEGTMRTELGGSAEVRYLRNGLACVMTVPAVEIVSREDVVAVSAERGESGDVSVSSSAGARILLVEYPAASGLETRKRLEAFGYRVLGPVDTVEEAARLADTAEFEVAIVDINLGERDVFPVLDILTTRNIPVAFMTAYRLLRLPPRYRDCLVLTKPLGRESVRRMFESGAGSLRLSS